jgi:ATP-dependent Clp protease ATP-binding subunit ClpA
MRCPRRFPSATTHCTIASARSFVRTSRFRQLLQHLAGRCHILRNRCFGDLEFDVLAVDAVVQRTAPTSPGVSRGPDGDALTRLAVDLTEKARCGDIDPVFGPDRKIQQMVNVLARRRKNNPILVGEPGVGKTALVEGLALRVSEGSVPIVIRDVRILTLDLGLLQAGAGVEGEFEQRLKRD